jgi:hypothetical protein
MFGCLIDMVGGANAVSCALFIFRAAAASGFDANTYGANKRLMRIAALGFGCSAQFHQLSVHLFAPGS